jgi:hypothetical protein
MHMNPLASIIPQEVLAEGGKQGALSATGGRAARVVGGVGKAAYRGALRPTVEMLRKFPNMVDDMMKIGVPLGSGGEAVAGKKLGEAVARKGVVLDEAEVAGAMVPTSGAKKMAQEVIAKARRSGLKVHERVKVLETEMAGFVRDNAANLTPNQANDLIQALQEEIDDVFAAKAKGTLIKGGQKIVTKLYAQLERGMREALRESVPKVKAANRAVQAAGAAKMGAAHAMGNAGKGVPARVPLVPTMGRSVIPDELRMIELWSRLGLGMNHPALQAILRQAPRGAAAAFGSGTMPPDTLRNGN